MPLDHATLARLRSHDPAWKLLRAEHAPLIASFIGRVFIAPNVRVIAQASLVEALEDELYTLREQLGTGAYPKSAQDYLNDWAEPGKGWLRKFYPPESDDPSFDLTPATEKALRWLDSLAERAFVGTESRLLTLFDLLRQMAEGSETNPAVRIDELERKRSELAMQIQRIRDGHLPLLDDTALKDRFQQFVYTARELLSDFREVEANFRALDRTVRERITLWGGSKGALLEDIMGERDAIADSDQGRSFRAFWDFLMSSQRQEELSALLQRVLELPAVAGLQPDRRTARIHYDWLDAGEHAQRTVAQLSQQLRRFLDDQAWLENKRIMDIIAQLEANALALRDQPDAAKALTEVMQLETPTPGIALPMERPLYTPGFEARIADSALDSGDAELDTAALFAQVVVDKAALEQHVRRCLAGRVQVTLGEICAERPLEHGLAELLAYLQLASESFDTVIDEAVTETVVWRRVLDADTTVLREARLPRVVFVR